MTEKEWLGDNELSLKIWNNKYRNGNETFDEWMERISDKNEALKELILNKKFIFGGRILANRNVHDRRLTYSNCYVISPPDDNIESIFDCAKKLARTYSLGGGCGTDLSKLRPRGASVNNSAKTTTGAVSFMQIFSEVTATIGQNNRRGALMISLDINHPDIEEFIDCKTDLSKVTFANISVRMNDEFMQAVEQNKDYVLRWPCKGNDVVDSAVLKISKHHKEFKYNELIPITVDDEITGYVKVVKARDLFTKLCKNNWDYAEPGILYWDRISNYNIVANDPDFEYAGTNP